MNMPMRSLSLLIGVSQNQCCKWHNGPYFPSFKHLIKLCKTVHGQDWNIHLLEYAELIDSELD